MSRCLGGGKFDFKAPVGLIIQGDTIQKKYKVFVISFTGLPIIWIETPDRAEIVSKEEYLSGSFKLVENVRTRSAGDIVEAGVNIKGRGNSTWALPQKPYRLKFNEKVSLLDEPADKSWVLLANYYDKTQLRNQLAFF